MTRPFERWNVLPHGKLAELDENLLTVTGELSMPLMDLPRRMTVVRLRDGRLVVYSAISLDDPEMAALEAWGRPAFLLVPNDKHRLDANAWKKRYPAMLVVSPPGARAKIEESVPVDTAVPDFADPDVSYEIVPGTGKRESALVVRSPGGTTLVLNDIVGNIRDEHGVGGWLLRRMGFAGDEPHVPLPVKWMMIDDPAALRDQLRAWSELPDLVRILVSHGAPIEQEPRQVLLDLADTLG